MIARAIRLLMNVHRGPRIGNVQERCSCSIKWYLLNASSIFIVVDSSHVVLPHGEHVQESFVAVNSVYTFQNRLISWNSCSNGCIRANVVT